MKISNLDVGLRSAMESAFRAKNLSPAAARAKATQRMQDAERVFYEALANPKPFPQRQTPDPRRALRGLPAQPTKREKMRAMDGRTHPHEAAMSALRTVAIWARSI